MCPTLARQARTWLLLLAVLRDLLRKGVASAVDGDTVVSLEARADAALYQAKSTGRDRVCLAPAPTAITMPAGSAAT